ncbi:MAG TPA: hypothetical protein VFH83_09935 [Spirochaetia bacterium]|nr:hypothetical protein [Spirochaetia bacterium]
MNRAVVILLAFVVCVASVEAQDAQKVVDTYKRNFAIASLDVKIQILQDATTNPNAAAMGPLYEQALEFALDNASLIDTDVRFSQLAAIAAKQVGAINYKDAALSLWRLFPAGANTEALTAAAGALAVVAAGNVDLITNLNRYVDSMNTLYTTGKMPDPAVLSACIQALGALGDPSSFPTLFSAVNLGYSDQITAMARAALLSIKGDLGQMLQEVMRTRPMEEKKLALQMALDNSRLTDDQKGAVAEYALDVGLHTSVPDAPGKATLRDIRFLAASAVAARKRAHASGLMVENLDMTISEYDKNLVDRGRLLDSIAELGAMGTHEAAARLTQYLVLLNSYVEKGKTYDESIMLTLIGSLGTLGDKVAFDDLMYTQYLQYSATVKKAARASLDKLQW